MYIHNRSISKSIIKTGSWAGLRGWLESHGPWAGPWAMAHGPSRGPGPWAKPRARPKDAPGPEARRKPRARLWQRKQKVTW